MSRLPTAVATTLAAVVAVLLAGAGLPGLGRPSQAAAAPGPSVAPEWWFDSWGVPGLWSSGADGHGITIAVVDTGVQASLPELRGKVLAGADFSGNGSDGRTDYDTDDFSHGTAMSSIMVADKGFAGIEGLAPAARILPIVVPLRGVVRHGTPPANATSSAIDYAVQHGAKIINMSLGGVREESTDGPDPCPGAVQQSVLRAVRAGVLVVAASGNSGDGNSPVEEPGVCLGVVSVGAVDQNLNVASFSSRHPYLTVSAPGDNIPTLSRNSAYIGEGTSQATALTSAALALIWSKYPTESARQILTRLLRTVIDRGPAGRDPAYGFGVIDPARAIAAPAPAPTVADPVLDGALPLLATGAGQSGPRAMPVAGAAAPSLGNYAVTPAVDSTGPLVYLLAGFTLLFLLLALLAFGRIRRGRTHPPAPVG